MQQVPSPSLSDAGNIGQFGPACRQELAWGHAVS
jgi:hypothetical protein